MPEQEVHAVKDGRNLFFLALGRLISTTGSGIFSFALSLYVLDITGSSTKFATVLSASIIPSIFVNLLGGVIVDRFSKKKIMIIAECLSAILTLGFIRVFILHPENIYFLVCFAVLISIAQSFFNLAVSASIPQIVEKENVSRANGLLQTIGSLLMILAPVLGAVAYKTIGMNMIFAVNGFTFLFSGLLILFIAFYPSQKQDPANEENNFIENIRLALFYLKDQNSLKFILSIIILINIIFVPLMLLVIPYINYHIIQVSGIQLSFIEASFGMGATIGGIFISTQKNTDKYIKRAFMLLGLQACIILLWIFPRLFAGVLSDKDIITLIFCLLLGILGLFNVIQNIPLITYFQIHIPEELRGRVLGFMNVAILTSTPLGFWLFGWLLEFIPWYIITATSGSLILLACMTFRRNKYFLQFTHQLSINEKN